MHRLIFPVAAAAALFGGAVHAAGVVPGSNLSVTFDSDFETELLNATGTAIAGGTCDYTGFPDCDAQVDSFGFFYGFSWTDEDSFVIGLTDDFFSDGPSNLGVSATSEIMAGYEISQIVVAPSSGFLEFLQGPDNPTSPITDPTFPAVSFTNGPGTATIDLAFTGISEFWWPDGGYFLDFDVTFAPVDGGGPTPGQVPLPAPALMLGTALLGFAGLRRRRRG